MVNLIFVIILALTAVFTITPQFHILQQNSYFNVRFFDYLKENLKISSVVSVGLCAVCVALWFLNAVLATVAVGITGLVRVLHAVYKTKTAKKKIVYTGRVKRMYFTSILVSALIILICLISPIASVIALSAVVAFIPFYAMAVNIINAPVEWSMRQWYINDAKRILKEHTPMKIIGITGSYGKTSTKHILGRILSEKYNVTITPGGFNTTMGVVRTVRENLRADSEIFVVEMGAKCVGDIKEICDLVHPTDGIITSIGPQHLNTFGSIENVAKTKFELANECKNNGGKVYLNLDTDLICQRAGGYNSQGYGIENKSGRMYAENIVCNRFGVQFDLFIDGRRLTLSSKLLGNHNVLNICAAVLIASDLGVSDTDIIYAVRKLKPIEHRLEMKPFFNGAVLIDDAYNANPSGSLSAMNVIKSFTPMKRIVVTPGLVELGEKEYECNKALGAAAAESADELIFVGIERSKPLLDGAKSAGAQDSKIKVVKTFNDAAAYLKTVCDSNTAVIFENDLPDNYAK